MVGRTKDVELAMIHPSPHPAIKEPPEVSETYQFRRSSCCEDVGLGNYVGMADMHLPKSQLNR